MRKNVVRYGASAPVEPSKLSLEELSVFLKGLEAAKDLIEWHITRIAEQIIEVQEDAEGSAT